MVDIVPDVSAGPAWWSCQYYAVKQDERQGERVVMNDGFVHCS